MKKRTIPALLALCLLAACSGNSPAGAETTPETAPEQAASAEPENTPAETEETPAAPSVTLTFDPNAYRSPDDDDYFNALAYASNSGGGTARAAVRYKAYDAEGNILSVFDPFNNRRSEEFKTDLYIPAGAEDLPVGFTLAMGFAFDMSTGEEMPAIDHLEFEVIEVAEENTPDLRDHFTPGESEIRENHIYNYVRFDDAIGDDYTSLYPNYTLLGYSDGVLTAVCCKNDYPYGTSSMSVSYAKEHNDSSLLVYHHIPADPADRWELYLGCIAGQ